MSDDQQLMNDLRFEVRRCILGAGLSQAVIAGLLGITPKHMSSLMTGRAKMTVSWAMRITEVCGYEMAITFSRTITARKGQAVTELENR